MEGLAQLMTQYPQLQFIITTLGERGSVWTERETADKPAGGEELVRSASETISQFIGHSYARWRDGSTAGAAEPQSFVVTQPEGTLFDKHVEGVAYLAAS